MSIIIFGAGAFGTSLAQSFAKGGCRVTLWGRDAEDMQRLAETRQTNRLPGVWLDKSVTAVSDFSAEEFETVLLALPLQTLRGFLESQPLLNGKVLVACCKGVELETGLGPTGIIQSTYAEAHPAILTGPSFAQDIAAGLPTAMTLACKDAGIGKSIQSELRAPNLRIYRTTDTVGAELGGALKNIIAIACGAVIGAGFGESARAALMTRGFAEMNRLALKRGAKIETLAGLSGLGDLALTCSSRKSRNFQFGLALGEGKTPDPDMTVEGSATAKAALQEARRLGLEMPITDVVTRLIDTDLNLSEATEILLSRPLKEE